MAISWTDPGRSCVHSFLEMSGNLLRSSLFAGVWAKSNQAMRGNRFFARPPPKKRAHRKCLGNIHYLHFPPIGVVFFESQQWWNW